MFLQNHIPRLGDRVYTKLYNFSEEDRRRGCFFCLDHGKQPSRC